ncbi:MAG: hypothetical protein GXO28_00620 [Methanopyri archaeon]|nr:hypothetical protein [Methanopyri archaeon]
MRVPTLALLATALLLTLTPAAAQDLTNLPVPQHGVRVGVFVWGSTVRQIGVQQFVQDVVHTGFTDVAILTRGVSTPQVRTDVISAVYREIKRLNPKIKVYSWIVGFQTANGWVPPWDPTVRQQILEAVKATLPYCDGVILDDSFRYYTTDPTVRAKAMQAIDSIVDQISRIVHAAGKKVYFCLLPEPPLQYSWDRDFIASVTDGFIIEAYTESYHEPNTWPAHVYRLYEALYPGKIAIALMAPSESDLIQQTEYLVQAGCRWIWYFRYLDIMNMEDLKEYIHRLTEPILSSSEEHEHTTTRTTTTTQVVVVKPPEKPSPPPTPWWESPEVLAAGAVLALATGFVLITHPELIGDAIKAVETFLSSPYGELLKKAVIVGALDYLAATLTAQLIQTCMGLLS